MPRVDGGCLEAFLRALGKARPDNHPVAVMDNAPPQTAEVLSGVETRPRHKKTPPKFKHMERETNLM